MLSLRFLASFGTSILHNKAIYATIHPKHMHSVTNPETPVLVIKALRLHVQMFIAPLLGASILRQFVFELLLYWIRTPV